MFLIFTTTTGRQIGIRVDKIVFVKNTNDNPTDIATIVYRVTDENFDEAQVRHSVAEVVEAINAVYKSGW